MTSYCSSIHSLCSFSSDEPFNLLSSLHINGFICLWATPVVRSNAACSLNSGLLTWYDIELW
ncbi:hypothetical protein Hanom_Chr12g01099731 [Helianthus anomalus]